MQTIEHTMLVCTHVPNSAYACMHAGVHCMRALYAAAHRLEHVMFHAVI